MPVAAAVDPRPRDSEAELQRALDQLRHQHRLAGVSVALFDKESQLLLQSGPGIEPGTKFRLGNAGSLLVSIAVLALATDGSLSLDDGVLERAPQIDLRNQWYAERPVRLRDLLLHQSGLASPHFRDIVMPARRQPLLAAINRSFRAAETGFRPGSATDFSTINVAIAAYIAEQAANSDMQDIIDLLINAPLQAGFTLGNDGDGVAPAHASDGSRRQPLPLNLAVAADWWASAADLAVLGRLLVNRGQLDGRRLLDPSVVTLLQQSSASQLRGHGLQREMPGGHELAIVRGQLPGYLASFGYFPGRGGGFAILVNQGGQAAALAELEALLAGQLPAAPPARPLPAATPPPARLQGWYRLATPAPPPERLLRWPLAYLHASACGDALCLDGPLVQARRLQQLGGQPRGWLRDAGEWMPDWYWQQAGEQVSLRHRGQDWQRHGPVAVLLPLLLGLLLLLVSVQVLWQLLQLPLLAWRNRHRPDGWLELLPATLASVAVAAALLVPLLYYLMELQQLAVPGAMAIGLLVASLVTPVFASLSLPAYAIAWHRNHLYAPLQTALAIIAAGSWSLLFLSFDVLAFQSWNY